MALGLYPDVSLKRARELRDEARQHVAEGIDPRDIKRTRKESALEANRNSFAAVSDEWFATKMAHLSSSSKDRDPTTDLTGALTPTKKKHLAAITDPTEVGRLLTAIDEYQGTSVVRTALKLSPLLFCRPGELRKLEWAEIKWEAQRIELPNEKMKMRESHIIPLAKQSLVLLRELEPLTGRGKYTFPSARGQSRPLSDNGVRTALRSLGYDNETMTAHGFRAMARTLLDEVLGFRMDYIEHQLAHEVKDTLGRAYNRTKHLEQRAGMMQKWADYLDSLKASEKAGNIITAKFGTE